MGILLAGMHCILYAPSNHFHLFEPKILSFSPLDLAIPFIPITAWVYFTEYLFVVVAYLGCKNLINLNKYFYSFLVLQTVSVIIFYLWPTTYPRELFPLISSEMDSITYWAFSSLRVADTPANCCPSLHVSSVYLSSLIFLDDQPKKFPWFFLWATAVAISTLTTKQHYLIDVVTGFGMAALCYLIFHRRFSYHPIGRAKLT